MKIPSNVRLKRFPWTILPIFSRYTAHALYPNIYVPKPVYENLKSNIPEPRLVSVLIHEQTHNKRQTETGWLEWGFKYVFSGKFRFDEEVAAIAEAMKFYKRKGGVWDTEKSAKLLSGYLYGWCVSYKKAKELLDKTWKKA